MTDVLDVPAVPDHMTQGAHEGGGVACWGRGTRGQVGQEAHRNSKSKKIVNSQ